MGTLRRQTPTHPPIIMRKLLIVLGFVLVGCCSTQQTTTTTTTVHRDTVQVPVPFNDSAHVVYWTKDSIQVVHDTMEVPKWKIKIVRDSSGTSANVSVTPETLYVPYMDSTITTTTTTTQLSFWERFKTNWQIVLLGFAAGVVVIGVIIFLIKK